jgi:hypothetical protein
VLLTQQAVHAVQYSVVQQTLLHYSSAHSEVAVDLILWTDKQYRWLRPTYLTLLSSPLSHHPLHIIPAVSVSVSACLPLPTNVPTYTCYFTYHACMHCTGRWQRKLGRESLTRTYELCLPFDCIRSHLSKLQHTHHSFFDLFDRTLDLTIQSNPLASHMRRKRVVSLAWSSEWACTCFILAVYMQISINQSSVIYQSRLFKNIFDPTLIYFPQSLSPSSLQEHSLAVTSDIANIIYLHLT